MRSPARLGPLIKAVREGHKPNGGQARAGEVGLEAVLELSRANPDINYLLQLDLESSFLRDVAVSIGVFRSLPRHCLKRICSRRGLAVASMRAYRETLVSGGPPNSRF